VCAIASAQPNRELQFEIIAISERLSLAQRSEEHLFHNCEEEARRLAKLWEGQSSETLLSALERYYRRRVRKAAELAELIAARPWE
jgi:hypothetical protein